MGIELIGGHEYNLLLLSKVMLKDAVDDEFTGARVAIFENDFGVALR